MRRPRLRGRVRYAIALLIALFLVPMLARGTHHTHDASAARVCAVCVVTKHVPGVAVAPLEATRPVLVRTTFAAPGLPAGTAGDHPLHGGRAPPFPTTARTA
jgi:hypothetical protein